MVWSLNDLWPHLVLVKSCPRSINRWVHSSSKSVKKWVFESSLNKCEQTWELNGYRDGDRLQWLNQVLANLPYKLHHLLPPKKRRNARRLPLEYWKLSLTDFSFEISHTFGVSQKCMWSAVLPVQVLPPGYIRYGILVPYKRPPTTKCDPRAQKKDHSQTKDEQLKPLMSIDT